MPLAQYTCSIRKDNSPATWIHVAARNAYEAAHSAMKQARQHGRCTVDVYIGDTIPMEFDKPPAVSQVLIG